MKFSRLKVQNKSVLKYLAVILLCAMTLTLVGCTTAENLSSEVSKSEETEVQAPEKKKRNSNIIHI